MRRIWKICAWLLFLAFPFSAHAQESSLLLYPSSQEISVGEEFSVEIVGKELSNIAGGDIVVVYDKERLQLLSKQLLLSQEEILDLQKENESIQEMQDEENRCKFLFALRKNAELLSGEEKRMGVIRFQALKEGKAFVGLSERSRWILEEDMCEHMEWEMESPKMRFLFSEEDGLTYRYELPQFPSKALSIFIVEEEETNKGEKEEERDEEEDSGESDHPDEEESSEGESGRKTNRKRNRKEYFSPVSPADPVRDTVFLWTDPYQPDGLLHLFWRLNLIFPSEVLKYPPFPILLLYECENAEGFTKSASPI